MNTDNFLLELGTEELPPKLLQSLSATLGDNLSEQLNDLNLDYSGVHLFSTPRRLGVLISDLQLQQSEQIIERKGPSISAPDIAIDGFAKSCGTDRKSLQQKTFGSSDYYFFTKKQKGLRATDLLENIVHTAIKKIPIARPMRWGDSDFTFVRPIHWLVMMLGKKIVPANIMGLVSGNVSRGLRFAKNRKITITSAEKYEDLMINKAQIEVDFVKRRETIRDQVTNKAKELGATAVIDELLLDEVCALVEYPLTLSGVFDEKFLSVPEEALISAMKTHQKYFHMLDKDGKLLPSFITVANIDSSDISVIIDGNERVIRPRLSDAEFFWNQDRSKSLNYRIDKLESVLFMKSLGSMGDKTKRIESISKYIAELIGANVTNCVRTGLLSKSDLVSEMVGEFADLQGVMGGYYALQDGENESVALGIREHYHPRFAGDTLPSSHEGLVVSIADKIDTITGIYGIGQGPTGSKDPYALRRMALGLLRIMVESGFNINIKELIIKSLSLHTSDVDTNSADDIYIFLMDRLRAYYKEQNVSAKVFESVLAVKPDSPYDFHLRVQALNIFIKNSASKSLIEANKRIFNMLKDQNNLDTDVDTNILTEVAEKRLHNSTIELSSIIYGSKDYVSNMSQLVGLKSDIDSFFEEVMVNVEDEKIRNSRLSLLYSVRSLFLSVADVSYLS
jgi:glycyl-tRNA synthetase beta chain